MPLAIRIVKVGGDIQTGLSKRQSGVVKVQQIGLVFRDQILTSQQPLANKPGIVGGCSVQR